MRAVESVTFDLVTSASEGGGFGARWVADLMYDGQRRLQDVPIMAPDLSWDGSRFVVASGSVGIVWADDFGGSVVPRQVGDWFSPFGAELQIDVLITAGTHSERVPQGRFVIDSVPDAQTRAMLWGGRRVTAGEAFTVNVSDRLMKVNRDEFPVPTSPGSSSVWREVQQITGFPIVRNVADAAVSSSVAYEGEKQAVLNQLFDLLGAWPHLDSNGALTALPKVWGDPVDEIRGVISAPVSMSPDLTYNTVVVQGKDAAGDPIYAVKSLTEGFLRVANTDGSVSPFGQKPYRYQSDFLTTQDQCDAYASELLGRVSQVRGVTRKVSETFNPLREVGDVLSFDGGVVRVQQIRHQGGRTDLVVEVPDGR